MPPTEFKISVSCELIRTFIERTAFAVSNEDSRYNPAGALLVIKTNSLSMVATDGHRLSFVERANELIDGGTGTKCLLIVREILLEIRRLLAATQSRKLEFAENETAFSCRIDDHVLSWAKPVSQRAFPDYEAILLENRPTTAVVQATELRELIRCVCYLPGREPKVHLLMRLERGN